MSRLKIGIINGPNLNMLGVREPAIYGNISFEEYLKELKSQFPNIDILYYQSNVEGFIIDKLQEWRTQLDGLIINAGAYSHTSIAIADCLAYMNFPIVEVHISNVFAREEFRHHSYLSKYCKATISGMGLNGYFYAVDFLIRLEKK
jgi:3-dehydroquinate dehydratase-2